jgi:hypothetical protein
VFLEVVVLDVDFAFEEVAIRFRPRGTYLYTDWIGSTPGLGGIGLTEASDGIGWYDAIDDIGLRGWRCCQLYNLLLLHHITCIHEL